MTKEIVEMERAARLLGNDAQMITLENYISQSENIYKKRMRNPFSLLKNCTYGDA